MAKLQLTLTNKDQIPAGLEAFYLESDGEFTLQVEGGKTQEDIDRIQAALDKQRSINEENLRSLAKFKDVDLEKWEKVKDLDPNAPVGDTEEARKKLSEEYREKERALADQFKQKEADLEAKVEQANNKAKQYIKDSWMRKVLAEKHQFTDPRRLNDFLRAVKDDTDPDFADVRRAINAVEVQEESGVFIVVGGDLKDEKGADEMIAAAVNSDVAKYYRPAPGNQGGGAGGGKSPTHGAENPYKPETFNLSKQAELEEKSPELARNLAAQAGVVI